ncbi:MAG: DUF4979 domain-containing protein [Prevotella sp.]|nr:DUF4979 domain-containing protein [Prevotella sp.]
MMTKINKILGVALLAGVLFSCGENDAPIEELLSAKCPAKIEFQLPDNLQQLIYTDATGAQVLPLIKGERISLPYIMTPDDITFSDVIWSSSNPEIASVDDQGNVEALSGDGIGYSIVQVAPVGMFSGSGVNCNLKIRVSNTLIKAQSVSVSVSGTEVYAGETLQASVSILPEDATYRTVRWTSSNEAAATVDANGLITGQKTSAMRTPVTITATTLDGSNVIGSAEIVVLQIIQPQSVTIDQSFAAPNYYCAINEKYLELPYTTVPAECTKSLIEWTSSDESIATVSGGVVTFNQSGNFGDVTIKARCPETGNETSIKLNLAAGLIRETYHNPNQYSWYNAKQSGNGTSSSHVWHDGYITITTYTQNATNQRADIRCWDAHTWFHAGNYPIFAFRMDDVKDLGHGITSRNINIDAVGKSASGADYKAIANGNNKYLHDYKCSDGSHVFIYDLSEQACGTGGLMPTNETVDFTTLQIKHADMRTVDHQFNYNLYWVQTFKNMAELDAYVKSEGLTWEVIK